MDRLRRQKVRHDELLTRVPRAGRTLRCSGSNLKVRQGHEANLWRAGAMAGVEVAGEEAVLCH